MNNYNFNESKRMINSIWYSLTLFEKITHISPDDIYAKNANRRYCSKQGNTINFKQKGLVGKHEVQWQFIAKELRK